MCQALRLKPRLVTGDSWYSGVENLKFLRNRKLGFLFGIAQNRIVLIEPQKPVTVNDLAIPNEGSLAHLKGFGQIKLFRKDFQKGDSRHYIMYLPDPEALAGITRRDFEEVHDTHWGIESFHRAIKCVVSADLW